jgi:hypothetical protein
MVDILFEIAEVQEFIYMVWPVIFEMGESKM